MNARAMTRLMEGLPSKALAVTTSTFQADIQMHLTPIVLSRGAGVAMKMPRANGSGTILIVIQGIVTTTPFNVITTNPSATDLFAGSITTGVDNATTGKDWMTVAGASGSNTITLNSTTTGGATIGDQLYFIDIAAGIWAVAGSVIGVVGGGLASPFSRV